MSRCLTFLTLFGLVVVFGCKSSSTSPSSSNASGVGSTFTYHITEYNPDGSINQQDDETTTLTNADTTFAGMQHVAVFDNGGGSKLVFESNGDVDGYATELQDESNNQQWLLSPFSGGQGATLIFSNNAPLDFDAMTSSYTGSGTDTVNGTILAVKNVRVTDSTARLNGGFTPQIFTSTIDYSYAPSIEEMTRVDASAWTDAITGTQHGRTLLVLTSYTIK